MDLISPLEFFGDLVVTLDVLEVVLDLLTPALSVLIISLSRDVPVLFILALLPFEAVLDGLSVNEDDL